jgi:hypothetical protein
MKRQLPTQFRNSWQGPKWLRSYFSARFIYSLLRPLDILVEVLLQGLAAAFPGLGTPSALPFIGQSRGLIQGEAETNTSFAARLRAWLDAWRNAGADEQLALEIQAYIGNDPTVRVVNRAGFFVTAAPNGTISFTSDPAWNWDSVSNPERASWWSDLWIIITPSEFPIYANNADATWQATWGHSNGFGLGHQCSRRAVDAITGLVRRWKGAHTYVVAVIWVLPTNGNGPLFVPGNLGLAGNPDGTWGNWSKNVAGVQVASRTTAPGVTSGSGSVRYWEPQSFETVV